MNNVGCRMCFEKYNIKNLSQPLLLCQNCENTQISQSFKQCTYCRSDYKSTIEGSACPKCKSQLNKHGEPSACTICNLKMAYGNEVICVRCSHYRSKFGDPKQCGNCCQFSAFYKDESSRQKVDGKLLCWLCTYFYKFQKAKALKASKRRVDVIVSDNISNASKTFSSIEPLNKKTRTEGDVLPLYSNDAAYNEQLMKVSTLQDEVKDLKRKLATKESELLSKDNVIAGLKADILQRDKDSSNREITLKSRWDKEKSALLEKLKSIQKENIALLKGGRKKRQTITGFDYITRDPLTRAPSLSSMNTSNSPKPEIKSAADSPKPDSPKPESKLSIDPPKPISKLIPDSSPEDVKFDIGSPEDNQNEKDDESNKNDKDGKNDKESNKDDKEENTHDDIKNDDTNHECGDKNKINGTSAVEDQINTNEDKPESNKDFENDSSELSLNSNSKDNSSAEASPANQ